SPILLPYALPICLYSHGIIKIIPLSLHDALPICKSYILQKLCECMPDGSYSFHTKISANALYYFDSNSIQNKALLIEDLEWTTQDRKSTRLNSSHVKISYAVFCLKKKNTSLNY